MPDCIFCNICRGWAPADIRHESDEFLAFDDLFPKAATHLLVVPRAHHDNLDTWLRAGGSEASMLDFAAATARHVGIAGGYRLLTNVGREAGQMIPHLHWHLLGGELPVF